MNFIDLELVRRLEMASAKSGKSCADRAQTLHPELGAASEEIAGGIAVYAGIDSPVTQALGIGLDGEVSEGELDRLEDFFRSRGAATAIELCPFAGIPLYEMLAKREYRLVEVSNALFRELAHGDFPLPEGVTVRPALPEDRDLFTQTVAQGFAELAPITQALLDVMSAFFDSEGNQPFLAFADGVAAGGGSVFAFDGVAGMFGASTLPQFRGRAASNKPCLPHAFVGRSRMAATWPGGSPSPAAFPTATTRGLVSVSPTRGQSSCAVRTHHTNAS